MTDRQNILNRLRSLRILADPTRGGTPAERDTAQRLFDKLKAKHNIADHEVPREDQRASFRARPYSYYGAYTPPRRSYSTRAPRGRRGTFVRTEVDDTTAETVFFIEAGKKTQYQLFLFEALARIHSYPFRPAATDDARRRRLVVRAPITDDGLRRMQREFSITATLLKIEARKYLRTACPPVKNPAAFRRAFYEEASRTLETRLSPNKRPHHLGGTRNRNPEGRAQGALAGDYVADRLSS